MTLHARLAFDDCQSVVGRLRAGVFGQDWRINWVSAVSLLRATMHVLHKVDEPSDPYLKAASGDAFAAVKANHTANMIYHKFIEDERNNLMKEYKFAAGQNVKIGVSASYDLTTQEFRSSAPTATHSWTMQSGQYTGRDARDVLEEAVEWLDRYLTAVEQDAERRRAAAP